MSPKNLETDVSFDFEMVCLFSSTMHLKIDNNKLFDTDNSRCFDSDGDYHLTTKGI